MDIKVILFDSDGVLAHTEELFFEINGKCFADIGIPYPRESFEHHTFLTDLGTTGFMKNLGCSDEQIADFKNNRNRLWQEAVTQSNVVDKTAEEVFIKLKEKYKIGIVTNTNRENFDKTYHSSNIPMLADFIITREDYENGKPAPDSYLAGLELSQFSAAEAVVVEDSPRGITAAKAANITTIAIPNPVIENLDVSEADYKISSLSELPELLDKLTKQTLEYR
jgi:HAD superfamily hydrolase (TIGR01509 family)